MTGPGSDTAPPPPAGSRRIASARLDLVALGLLAAGTTLLLECARVLYSVAFYATESMGNLPAGALVVAVFAAPLLAAPLRRLLGARSALGLALAAMVVGRLALQGTDRVGLPLAVASTGLALVALALVVAAAGERAPSGRLAVALGVTLGMVADGVVRATGTTWDVVWRQDVAAWAATLVLVAVVATCGTLAVRHGLVPEEETAGMPLVAFLVWPYLYLGAVFTLDPAFLASQGWVRPPAALAVALAGGAASLPVIVVSARRGLSRLVQFALAAALGIMAFSLPSVADRWVLVMAVLVQLGAAALLGAAAGAEPGSVRVGITRTGAAFTGGSLWMAVAVLAYAIHTLQPLPFTNRVLPGLVAASMALAASSATGRDRRARLGSTRTLALVTGSIAALAVLVPVAAAVTWPSTSAPDLADRPLRVMTFNIDQGLTEGQLQLEQLATEIERSDADVVVLEEVGRGWALSGMTDTAGWFSRRLGMPFVWAPAADGQFGNVVLSRVPVTAAEVVPLGKGNGTQDRSAVFVTLDAGGGQEVRLIGTHLMNGSDGPMHESRAEAYRTILDRWDGAPATVLLGDLNTYPREVPPGWPELDLVLGAGFSTTQDVDHCSMPTSNENCPDWIFTTPDLRLSPVRIVVDRPDHRPIVADVSLP